MKISRSNLLIGVVVVLAVMAAVAVVFRAATMRDRETGLSDVFIYDLDEIRKTDPALIRYEETGKIETGFENVSAIAVDSSDRVYVAGDRSIRVFDKSGNTLWEIKLTGAPRCLAVADDGDVYAGMRDHVEVYEPDGARKASWEDLGQDAVLTSVAVSDDYVFVADAGRRVVLRYDRSGELVNRIGERDEDRNIPGFIVPSPCFDLAVAPDGLLRVVNPGLQRIEAYTYDGDLEFWWGKPSGTMDGFVGCCNPANLAILQDGGFVTCEKGLPRVKTYDADGIFQGVVAGAELFAQTEEAFVMDVAVDSQGRVMVLDPVEKAVRIFTLLEGID